MVPASFRAMIGDSVALTKGLHERCLFLFSVSEWETVKAAIRSSAKLTDPKARRFERHFVGSAYEGSVDKLGRIIVPQELRDYANIKKDVVVTALTSRIEIWDSASWDEEMEQFDPDADMVIDI
jgi:MraZ protein